MPRHAHARRGWETERRTDAPPFLIFFWAVRLKPHDRNRLNACATQSGLASGVLADAPAASADARPNGPEENTKDRHLQEADNMNGTINILAIKPGERTERLTIDHSAEARQKLA